MPRNKKPKHRVLDPQSIGEHNEDNTVFTNLGANDDNVSPMDQLKVLQEMFRDRIESDVIHDVFQECAFNAEQTLENLLELCDSNHCLPCNDSSMSSSATKPLNSLSSSSHPIITEVPHIVSEPPLNDNTNDNFITQSTRQGQTWSEKVHNSLALKPQSNHQNISPLNAVMPFANLFSPKHNNSFGNCSKSSPQSSQTKKLSFKDEIKNIIKTNNEKLLILMRGLPGSGKTTLAQYLLNGSTTGVILSTDQYFNRNGVYRFEPTQLPIAHEWNQKRCKDNIKSGSSPIIIDNTNLEVWEMKPYVSLGYSNGYKIYFLEPDTAWNRNPKELSRRNIHNVSKEKIENMIYKFANVTVSDVIKSLPSKPSDKSLSSEKVELKSFTQSKAATNIALKDMKITLANNTLSSDSAEEYPESSPSPISTKVEEISSSPSQKEDSTSLSNTTEPTSPSSPSRIDIDLLLALNERNVDSEDCSSINASDGGSSGGVSQESGWERDEEFTWSVTTHNTDQQIRISDNYKDSDLIPEETLENKSVQIFCDSDSKPKRERKPKSAESKEDCIEEENPEDIEFTEPWDENDKCERLQSINALESSSQSSSSNNNNNKRLFGLVGVRKPNWEFPPFPINDSNDCKNDSSEISIICYSRPTQTERKDWALLELKQCNKSNEGLETENVEEEENIVICELAPNRSLPKVKLHKGTFTSDIPDDLTKAQKLDSLRLNFPKAEDSHLNDILDACHEDYNWAKKLLSELNEDHFDVGNLEQMPTGTESAANYPEGDAESNVHKDVKDVKYVSLDDLPSKLVHQKTSEEPKFVLTLDPNLAAQLELHFGPLSDKSSLNSEDLTLTLSHGVARLLHHNWKKSLNQKVSGQSTSQSSIKHSINHNFIDYKSKNLLLAESPKTEFQEIMDFELAMSLSRQEYDDKIASKLSSLGPSQNPLAKELLSTKLKRDQLYKRYPGVDKGFLDEIFESNNFCLGKTIEVIDNSLGESDDFNNETEALIAEERGDSPLNNSRSTSPTKSIRRATDLLLLEMNKLLNKKKEYHDKAQLAYQRKMFAVASYYGDEAGKFYAEVDRIGKEIVDNILNACSNSNELDLHGLHITEVNVILSEYLRRKSDELKKTPGKRKLYVDIITGYGATKGIQGRIKPTVIQYLKQKNLTYDMVNMGVIRVILTQQS